MSERCEIADDHAPLRASGRASALLGKGSDSQSTTGAVVDVVEPKSEAGPLHRFLTAIPIIIKAIVVGLLRLWRAHPLSEADREAGNPNALTTAQECGGLYKSEDGGESADLQTGVLDGSDHVHVRHQLRRYSVRWGACGGG